MRRLRLAIGTAIIALAVSSAAGAEPFVDYSIDETTAAHNSVEQGVALAPLPVRGSLHLAVQVDPAVDHEVLRAGVMCGFSKIRNPLELLVGKYMAAWDAGGAPAATLEQPADLAVKIDRASTFSRCVGTGELKMTCITRVSIDGSSTRTGKAAQPFHVEREEPVKGIGLCAGLTRGIGLVSRATVAVLVSQLAETSAVAK